MIITGLFITLFIILGSYILYQAQPPIHDNSKYRICPDYDEDCESMNIKQQWNCCHNPYCEKRLSCAMLPDFKRRLWDHIGIEELTFGSLYNFFGDLDYNALELNTVMGKQDDICDALAYTKHVWGFDPAKPNSEETAYAKIVGTKPNLIIMDDIKD
jgi:hypothetical protein